MSPGTDWLGIPHRSGACRMKYGIRLMRIAMYEGIKTRFAIVTNDEPRPFEIGRIAKFWQPVPTTPRLFFTEWATSCSRCARGVLRRHRRLDIR